LYDYVPINQNIRKYQGYGVKPDVEVLFIGGHVRRGWPAPHGPLYGCEEADGCEFHCELAHLLRERREAMWDQPLQL